MVFTAPPDQVRAALMFTDSIAQPPGTDMSKSTAVRKQACGSSQVLLEPVHLPRQGADPIVIPKASSNNVENLILPQVPPLAPMDNLVHISNVFDKSIQDEDVDMELEAKIENYMLHLAKENDLQLMDHTNTAKVILLQRQSIPVTPSRQEPIANNRDVINPNVVPTVLGSTPVTEVCSQPSPIQNLSRPGIMEPTAITLELLGIDTSQGKRFSFIDDVEEKLE